MHAFVIYVNTFTEFLFVKQGIVCRETKIEWFVRDWNYSWASVLHFPRIIHMHCFRLWVSLVTYIVIVHGYPFRAYLMPFTTFLGYFHFVAAGDIPSNKYKFHADERYVDMTRLKISHRDE